MPQSMLVTESGTVRFCPRDARGNPACLADGVVPEWVAPDPTLAACVVAEDGMSAVITPVGVVGTLYIAVHAAGCPDATIDVQLLPGPPVASGLMLTDIAPIV